MKIPCLTLTQPYATLVAIGAKRIETRSWSTSYRGPLAIHAAKRMPMDARWQCHRKPFLQAIIRAGVQHPISDRSRIDTGGLPLGAVVAIATLSRCETTGRTCRVGWADILSFEEMAFGDYSLGRFGWLLTGPLLRLSEPIPARGMQGLWQWECPDDVCAQYQNLTGETP